MFQLVACCLGMYLGSMICTFVHELGHYIPARLFNFSILRFKVGGGPELLSLFRGSTQYVFSILPLAGGSVHVVSNESSAILKSRSYSTFRNQVENSQEFSDAVTGAMSNRVESRSTFQLAVFILFGPILEFVFSLFLFSILRHFVEIPFFKGMVIAVFFHLLIAVSQLVPFYLRRVGTDGFNFLLFASFALLRKLGFVNISIDVFRNRAKYVSWICWTLILIVLAPHFFN